MQVIVREIQPKAAKSSVCCEFILVPVAALQANHALAILRSLSFSAATPSTEYKTPNHIISRSIDLRRSISSCTSRTAAFNSFKLGSTCAVRVARGAPVLTQYLHYVTHSAILNNGSFSDFNLHYFTVADSLLEAFTVLLFGV